VHEVWPPRHVCSLTAGFCCLLQLKDLTKEYETTAEGQAVKLNQLLERERAMQAAATQLAAKRSQLLTSGQSAEVGATMLYAPQLSPVAAFDTILVCWLAAHMCSQDGTIDLQWKLCFAMHDLHCLCRRT